MNDMIESFRESFRLMRKDKYILVLSLCPVTIGVTLYALFGSWAFGTFYDWGMEYFNSLISTKSTLVDIFSYILGALLSIVLLFVVNFTFFMMVSLLAAPFNDLISTRVSKAVGGQELDPISESFFKMMRGWLGIIWNEVKKILFILLLSIIGLVFNFIVPVVGTAIAATISAFLLAMSFLDYSWSRKRFHLKDCLEDIRTSPLSYGLSGGFFIFLIGVPIINLFALPYGVIYYTNLHTRKYMKRVEA